MKELNYREKEVLRLLARGCRCLDIAYVLQTSSKAIEGHIHKICTKLEVDTEAEAVRWAVRQRIAET